MVKTSRGTWVAVEEVWDGDRLLELRPMRFEGDPESIAQARELREIVTAVEIARLRAQLREAEKRNRALTQMGSSTARYAAAG